LDALAREARLVFFAGLPGTGKSLLIHQLAHLAHARGRRIHLLQWDVARPVFEASEAGRRYPQDHGVTHGVIRLAVGRWLIELARPIPDDAEALLTSPETTFVIPVPSRELRAHLEEQRARRTSAPLHPRECE